MKNYLFLVLILLNTNSRLFSQTIGDTIKINEIIVSSTRNKINKNNLPQNFFIINKKNIKSLATNSIDDIFVLSPEVNVNRLVGIFGNSTVNLQGLGGNQQGRTLILLDGIPLNKADNGGVIFNKINISDIKKVEILYGANSSIYGNNAMGGIINFIPKQPKQGFNLLTKLSYASMNTPMASISLSSNKIKNNKGFYWQISSFTRNSNGYISQPDSLRDSTSIATFLKETDINTRLGYKINKKNSIKLFVDFYNDKRGYGVKIFDKTGGYSAHKIYSSNIKYLSNLFGFNLSISPYIQQENYFKLIEKYKKGNYSLIYAKSKRIDYGVLTNFNKKFKNNNLSFGIDYKNGSVNAADEYQTSSDIVKNSGNINDISFYISNNLSLLNDKGNLMTNVYYDYITIFDNKFFIYNQTNETSFMQDFTGNFPNKKTSNISGSFAFGYKFNNAVKSNISISNGFRSPSLDDMCRSGFFAWGYKQANTDLKPENIISANFNVKTNIKNTQIKLNTFYSLGNNFLYYIATGETIFGGHKRVYKMQNIEQVKINGISVSVNFNVNKKILLFANYSYQKSKILKNNGDTSVINKQLTYYPNNIANLGLIFNNKFADISSSIHYQSKSYVDDANTGILSDFYTVDVKLSRKINNNFNVNFSINNIFDKQYIVYYDQLSVGRFIKLEVIYKLHK